MAGEVQRDITVMTWNVENLFLPGPSGPPDEETYQAKLRYLAAIIEVAAPDAVSLQEIGDPTAAAALCDALGEEWRLVISKHPDPRGIRVGVLARHPAESEAEVDAFPPGGLRSVPDPNGRVLKDMGRGALQVRVTLPGDRRLRVVAAHLKSKLLTFPGGRRFPLDEDERARGAGFAALRRTAEAVAVRVHLNGVMLADRGIPTVLAGDLNDGPTSVTTELLTGPADGDPTRPDKGDPVRLYNLADRLAPGRAFSRIFRGRGELIDHLLVSRDLLLAVRSVDALVDGIASVTESVTSRRKAIVPDHAPLVARFVLP